LTDEIGLRRVANQNEINPEGIKSKCKEMAIQLHWSCKFGGTQTQGSAYGATGARPTIKPPLRFCDFAQSEFLFNLRA